MASINKFVPMVISGSTFSEEFAVALCCRIHVYKKNCNFKNRHKIKFQPNSNKNKEERYSRVPRLSDTRYSKGNGDMQAAKRD